MNHYFSKDNDNLESKEKSIHFKIQNKSFHFITDNGVFSKSGLDFGSRLLIQSIVNIFKEKVLDLGSGYGPVGIVYKSFNNASKVVLIDINKRAYNLCLKNATLNKQKVEVINGNSFDQINQKFDMIITNPPVRTGKKNIYRMFSDAYQYLNDNGLLIFVLNKQQGALSAIKFNEGIYKKVEVINKKSGFMIIKCIK